MESTMIVEKGMNFFPSVFSIKSALEENVAI
jgi:hypothetical protein